MALAKYAEDNYEIYLERMADIEYRKNETSENYNLMYRTNKSLPSPTISVIRSEQENDPTALYQDIHLICRDCGKEFLFTVQQQVKYAQNGYREPKRCKRCCELNKIRHLMK